MMRMEQLNAHVIRLEHAERLLRAAGVDSAPYRSRQQRRLRRRVIGRRNHNG